jgi:hypothetical protein
VHDARRLGDERRDDVRVGDVAEHEPEPRIALMVRDVRP